MDFDGMIITFCEQTMELWKGEHSNIIKEIKFDAINIETIENYKWQCERSGKEFDLYFSKAFKSTITIEQLIQAMMIIDQ